MVAVCIRACVILALTCSLASAGPIHEAASDGDLDKVRELLEGDPALLNEADDIGRTPLHWACRGVHEALAAFLIEEGAEVNIQDQYLVTPLHSAAARGNLEVSSMLIESGAGVNIPDIENHVPLHYAATGRHDRVVALLIANGADLEVKDNHGRTPLVLAAREMGGPDVIRVLLEAGADIDSRDEAGAPALGLAAWRGTADVVDLLLERGAYVPAEGREAKQLLAFAASKGLKNLFEVLADKGVELEFDTQGGGDLLHSAAAGGSPEIIRLLIDRGFDPRKQDTNGWTPLHFAADMNRVDAARLLVETGSDIDSRTVMGQTAYNIAEEWDYGAVLEALAAMGADTGPPKFPELRGEYMGQKPPGREPEVFARGIVNARFGLHCPIVFSPDGKQAFWSQMIPPRQSGYGSGRVMTSTVVDGKWTYPEPAIYDGVSIGDCPVFSPDGRFLYDISDRPMPGESREGKERIWRWTRRGDKWTDPEPLDAVINDLPLHWQFGVDAKANVYFSTQRDDTHGGSDIYCSELIGGSYQPPYNLGEAINTDAGEGMPFADPDGAYILFSRDDDFYISFRDTQGEWMPAVSLGEGINTPAYELCPTVSPDGKYLFFLGGWALQWVDAGIIEEIKAGLPAR